MYKYNKQLKRGMGKRGQVDLLFFVIIITSLAIFFLILKFVVGAVTDGMLANPQVNGTPSAVSALNYGKNLTNSFDYIYLTLFVGLILGTLIASVLIDVHWVFIPIWIILFGITIIVGVIMNNVYAAFVQNSTLAASEGTFASAIIGNFVPIIIGVGVLSMILIFGKTFKNRGGSKL